MTDQTDQFHSPSRGIIAIVAGITLFAWLPSVANDFVEWDDLTFIANNPRFNPPNWQTVLYYWQHPGWNLYMPVSYTLWAGVAAVSYINSPDTAIGTRLNPYTFHLTGVLLHVIATVALYLILRRVLSSQSENRASCEWPAMIGALVFGLHPLQVESVVFIGTMNTPIAGSLALVAMWVYLRGVESDSAPEDAAARSSARRWLSASYLLATALFALALLAKPTAIIAPAAVIVLDVATHGRSIRRAVLNALPWIVLMIPCVIWTNHFQPGSVASKAQPVWFRPIIAGDAISFYLGKLVVPIRLGIDYGRNPAAVRALTLSYVVWLLPAIILAGAWLMRSRARILLAAVAIFFVAMLPNSGLVAFDYQEFSTTTDRYAYLAMIGVSLAVAALVAAAGRYRRLAITVAVIWLAALTVLTERQIRVWRNGEALFRHAIDVNPNSYLAMANLAFAIGDNSPDEAIAACRRAMEIKPDYAPAANNLGSLLMARGDRDGALKAFAVAHHSQPQEPLYATSYARALTETNHRAEAAAVYQEMLERDPNSETARTGLAHLSASTTGPSSTVP